MDDPQQHPEASRMRDDETAVAALLAQASALGRSGRWAEATGLYARVLEREPRRFDALQSLGLAAAHAGDLGLALRCLDAAISVEPDNAGAHINRGTILRLLRQPQAALESFERAIAIAPHAQAFYNRAVTLNELGRRDEALASYDRAIAIQPDHAEAFYNRGLLLEDLNRPEAALRSYDRALAIRPDFASAHYTRGIVLHKLGRLDAALESYDRAIHFRADFAQAYGNRGNVLNDLGKWDAALESYDRALAIDAGYAEAHYNRGVVLREMRRIDAAIQSYDRALALRPDDAEALWNKSLAVLLAGDFAEGWALYESRWKRTENARYIRSFAAPLWLGGEALEGRTILLHPEQGFGDAIQFCRYAVLVAGLGARVLMEAPRELLALFRSLDGVSELLEMGKSSPRIDFQCPLMSLPLAFGTRVDTVPCSEKYLRSDPGLVSEWSQRLGASSRPRVGIVWSGRPAHTDDTKRSIQLEKFLQLLGPGHELVSLQRDVRPGDEAILRAHPEIRHFGAQLRDFADTAALCDLMDLVVSVDTSVAHLAAALGRRVWVLLPWVPDWRWLLDRDDSPWYPTAKLFRQERRGDWQGLLERVKADLLAFDASHSRSAANDTTAPLS